MGVPFVDGVQKAAMSPASPPPKLFETTVAPKMAVALLVAMPRSVAVAELPSSTKIWQ